MDFSVCPKQQEVIVRNSANCRHGSPISPARPRDTTLFRPWLCTSGRESMERRNRCLQKEKMQYQKYYDESVGRKEPYPEGPVYISHTWDVCQVHGCVHRESTRPSMTVQSCVSVHTTRTRTQPHMMYGVQEDTFTKESSRNSNANMDTTPMLFVNYTIVGEFYVCGICKKRFYYKRSMKRHFRIHTGERPYECNTCWMAFAKKWTLTNHARIHTGEKPYVCGTCYKAFNRKSNLNRHELIHIGE